VVATTVVRRYRVGTCFTTGDPASLAAAVRAAPLTIDPTDLATARRELSNRGVVRRQLLTMGIVTTG